MSKLVSNYSSNGSSTTDEYGTFVGFNRFMQGDVIEGFQVVANGTPNMTVLVQPGSGRITTGTYPASYGYLISHDTALPGESVTIAISAASPRIDYVLAYIDKAVAGSTSGANVNNTNNVLKFASVAGTPSGSPVVPTLSQIQTAIGAANPYIILAQVAVAANVSTITNPNITDLRVFATSRNALALGGSSYVDNGCVWTISSGLAGTMTKGLVYINVNGVMVPVNLAVIASQTFLASKDTYVSVDVTGTVSIANAVSNNATSPTLPANTVWLAIVVTSGSAITSVTSSGNDSNGKAIRKSAPSSSNPTSATVATTESTSSSTYADMTTVGPAVTANIGPSGSALVTVTCHSYNSAVNDTFMSFAVSGASTQAASDNNAKVTSTTSGQQGSTATIVTGLTPGTTTFTSKYKAASGTGSFLRRTISVVPL